MRRPSRAVGLVAVMSVASVAGGGAVERAVRSAVEVTVPAVTLVDAGGHEVRLDRLLATTDPMALELFFTSCPGVCPTLTATLVEVGRRVPAAQMVAVSIDPEVDTPARLAEYGERLRAGERWTFLTGRREDSIAVQRAFDAYRGEKMRHQPLVFLRPSGNASWLRVEGFATAAELAQALTPQPGDAARGRRVAEEGASATGDLSVTLSTGGVLRGSAAACSTCHRKSGAGGVDGGLYVPPIYGRALFGGAEARRVDLFHALYQEDLAPETWARLRQRSPRPAYTSASLARALREGVDPTGRELDALMPRYALDDDEVADLEAYLRTLGSEETLGVDASVLDFATVVGGGESSAVDARQERAMLATVDTYVHWHNAEIARLRQRRPDPLGHEDDLANAYREWRRSEWRLGSDPALWRQELEHFHRERPVFAVLGGMSGGIGEAVRAFCEDEGMPCLLLGDSAAPRDGKLALAATDLDGSASFTRHLPARECPANAEPPQAFRARQWLRARGIPPGPDEALQLATYHLLSVAEVSIRQLLDNFSRQAFVEAVDREGGRMPPPSACAPSDYGRQASTAQPLTSPR